MARNGDVNNTLPWEQSIALPLPDFLAAYTVHDSYWGGVFLSPDYFFVVLLQWDTFWSKGRVPYGTEEHPRAFPWLAIRLEKVYHVQMSYNPEYHTDVIMDATSTMVPDAQRTALFDSWNLLASVTDDAKAGLLEEKLLATTISAIDYDTVLLHAGETRFLCIDVEGRILPIPYP